MGNIRAVHDYLVTLLEGITITEPVATSINRAYKYSPASNRGITDLPCALLGFQLEEVDFQPGLLTKHWAIGIQVLVGRADADLDMKADIASEFLEKIIQALSDHLKLGGTVKAVQEFRGASPATVTLLEFAGVGYVGLDLSLKFTISEAKEHAA